jgi:hypothetical protein
MTNIAQIATSTTVEPVQAKPQPIRYDWMDEVDYEMPEIPAREKDRPTGARLEGRFENWGSD